MKQLYKYEKTVTRRYSYEVEAHNEEEAFKLLNESENDYFKGEQLIDSDTEYKGCTDNIEDVEEDEPSDEDTADQFNMGKTNEE